MLTKSLKSILAVATIASTAAFASVGTANAGSVNLYIGGPGVGVHFGSGKRHRNVYRGHHRPRAHRVCKPRRALNKAWNMGVNRPHIKRVGRNRIVVVGYNYGHRAKVVFARQGRHCPVIRTRGI